MTDLELDFLSAARDLAVRQDEMYAALATTMGIDPYAYVMFDGGRPDRFSRGRMRGGWSWRFHGIEVDVDHVRDGRNVRIDFGPADRRIVLSGWGVFEYVLRVRAPWRMYPALREQFEKTGPPANMLRDLLARGRLERVECLGYDRFC